MSAFPPGLTPHKGLRGKVLLELKRDQPLTTRELGERFGVSSNAVRRHLRDLEGDGLVERTRQRGGFGAPAFAYSLSSEGEAIFPRQYEDALTDVLQYVAETAGRERVQQIFADRFRAGARELEERLGDAPVEERVQAVVDMLSRQGFMADWTVQGNRITIAEHNCAVQAAAEQFPEICEAEAAFLRSLLQADLERRAHISQGCNACEYSLRIGMGDDVNGEEL